MKTVHFFRHQHGGVVNSPAFAQALTEEQMRAMNDDCDRRWGPGWGSQIEVDLIEDGTAPSFDTESSGDRINHIDVGEYVLSGTGFVDNATATEK